MFQYNDDNIKNKFNFEERSEMVTKIKQKYPNKIPIYVRKNGNSNIPKIDRNKYLVPSDLTMGQFMHVIRKRIKLAPETAIYMFVNNRMMPASSSPISVVYQNYKDLDGFLYMTYTGESTFG